MAVGHRKLWRARLVIAGVTAMTTVLLSGCAIFASKQLDEEEDEFHDIVQAEQTAGGGWGECNLSDEAAEPAGTSRKGGISDAGVRVIIQQVCFNPPKKCEKSKFKNTAPLLAAQIYQESKGDPLVSQKMDRAYRNDPDYNPNAVARGIAQFMIPTWNIHGIDANGDKNKNVLDPEDAIPSMASYNCELYEIVKDIPGDKVTNTLAAYNAGPGAVEKYKGVPPYEETKNYVADISYNAGRYAAEDAPVGIAGDGTKGKPRGYIAAPAWKAGDEKRVKYRGVTLNVRTVRMLEEAERGLGAKPTATSGHFRISQGSFSTSVSASGGTHSGGGAMDVVPVGNREVGALRAAGFAAWARSPSEGPWAAHIHAIAVGDPTAASGAKAQMQNFMDNENGLTNHGPDTYRPPGQPNKPQVPRRVQEPYRRRRRKSGAAAGDSGSPGPKGKAWT